MYGVFFVHLACRVFPEWENWTSGLKVIASHFRFASQLAAVFILTSKRGSDTRFSHANSSEHPQGTDPGS